MSKAKKKPSIAMASEIVLRDPAELLAYPTNSRTHSSEQIDQIVASIMQFGFTNPILIRENTIGAGHGRLLASIKLEMRLVPTIDLSHLSETDFKAYVIADNQLAMNAGWDFDILKIELEALEFGDFDVSILGFDDLQLSSIFIERQGGGTDVRKEWEGMPEFEAENLAHRTLKVHFICDDDVQAFFSLLDQRFTERTRFVWYPEAERLKVTEKAYE